MIERGLTVLAPHPTLPGVIVGFKERAYLTCGCSAFFGIRFDNYEVAEGTVFCSEEHKPLMEHFHLLLKESLVDPNDRPAVEVADELLAQAAKVHG